MYASLDEAGRAIIAAGSRLDARGFNPATAGNYSVRLSDGRIAITTSGSHKGRLTLADVMLVDGEGAPLTMGRPSAETLLHTSIYGFYSAVNAVLHVHSVATTALTRHLSAANEIVLEGYEMLKVFPGITTHDTFVSLPIYDNSQDIKALSQSVTGAFKQGLRVPAYLIRGHGAYGWGRDIVEAERVVEALEHILLCEIETLRLRGGGTP